MKSNLPKAPKEAVSIVIEAGKSPVIQLKDSPEARSWLEKVIDACYIKNITDQRYRQSNMYQHVSLIVDKLKTLKPFILWDLCFEAYPNQSNGEFESICEELFAT